MATEPTKYNFADLDKLYSENESIDAEVFAEMRSNLLLIAGEHYNRREASFFRRIRDSKELTDQQKLRLTKNHVQKIVKIYVNNIISMAPGVGFEPKNETELSDQKAAELHQAVWLDAKERYRLDEKIDDWCDEFVGVGEVAVKVFYDPTAGDLLGHNQALDPETGEPLFDEQGQPQLGEPVYRGEIIFEQVLGFNLIRPQECKDMSKAEWLCVRKMASIDGLKAKFPDKHQIIQASADSTVVVFDATRAGYRKTQNEVMLREFYFRSCDKFPRGYFVFMTKEGILAEGELPGGIFPIVVQQYDKIPTTPRGRGPVKIMRPFQAEINRAASKIAEHHITLGDDKLLIQNGTKVSAGVSLPGVRSINYTGAAPEILAGRSGDQYLAYMQAQIVELYEVMNVKEDSEEKSSGQMDPYALLFRSASQKKKFSRYVRRFERFLIELAKTYIRLAKIHFTEDMFILAVGKREQVNIAEFKNADDISYEVKTVAQSDDIETKFGKQLVLNHALQYVGNKLDKEDIGKMMRAMPYSNFDESFGDMTLDYDSATNMILALDRGEQVVPTDFDNNVYMIKRLVARMRQADFKFLHPEIQQNYEMLKQQYQQLEVERQAALQAAQAGYIPTGGYLVTCDIYVADPQDPAKTRRARIPYEAIQWLIRKLETQGQSLEELEQMNQGAVAQMATMLQEKARGSMQADGMAAPIPA